MGVIDFLFPRLCVGCGKTGTYFCATCQERLPRIVSQICPMCGKNAIGGVTHAKCRKPLGMNGLISVYAYRDVMQRLTKKFKFRLVRDLAETMVGLVLDGLRLWEMGVFWRQQRFGVMPVPLHPARRRWRGFNHAEELGRRVAKGLRLPFADSVLVRVRKTESQAEMKVKLTRGEEAEVRAKSVSELDFRERMWQALKEKKLRVRSTNVRGAFGVKKQLARGTKVVLFDDVWTSGATMRECAKVLKRAGAEKIWGLTMAR